MRRKIAAGNWKMSLDFDQSKNLALSLDQKLNETTGNAEVIIAPSFPFLNELNQLTSDRLSVAAQNCADAESGAFTGEVSVSMLKSIGIKHVIVGHSERRHIYGESIDTITKKTELLLNENMIPIVCVGEELSDRKKNKHFDLVRNQLQSVLDLTPSRFKDVIIAYEPVWAIGTGETASPDQAQEMHAFIRSELKSTYGKLADNTRILYGGSVKPGNADELFGRTDVDGGLVGGASLNTEDFMAIIQAASK